MKKTHHREVNFAVDKEWPNPYTIEFETDDYPFYAEIKDFIVATLAQYEAAEAERDEPVCCEAPGKE